MKMKSIFASAVLLALISVSFPTAAANVPPLRSKNTEGFSEHPHWDYYLPSSHPTGRLASVESFHLKPVPSLLAENKLEYAYDELAFVIAFFPNHPKALDLITQVATRAKQPQVAEKHFRDAFELYPNRAQTHMLYGNFLSKSGQREKAIESYKRAIELDPNYAEGHYNLGLAYYHQKKYDLANTHAQTAYSYGYPLPGLERLLKEKKAWNVAKRPSAKDAAGGGDASKTPEEPTKPKAEQASKPVEEAAKQN